MGLGWECEVTAESRNRPHPVVKQKEERPVLPSFWIGL